MGKDIAGLGILGAIMASPLIIGVALIVIAVFFAVGYAILWAFGLITATILFVGGLFMLYIIGKVNNELFKNHPWVILLPIGLGVFGYVADHFHLKLLGWTLNLTSSETGPVDPVVLAVVLLVLAVGVLGVDLVLSTVGKGKRKRRR